MYGCVFGISYILDIPIIKMCKLGGSKWMDEWVGNPSPYAYVPRIFLHFNGKMNLWQRTLNALSELYITFGTIFYVTPQHDAILKQATPFNHPSLHQFQWFEAECRTVFWWQLGKCRTQPPDCGLPVAVEQRWHLAGSTGTRTGPVQLNASETLPCVGSHTQSSTRPAGVVWVAAGHGRYGINVAYFRGNCNIV